MEYRNGPSIGTAGIRGKDDERKLFVGGLPKTCGEKELKETFSKFGTIESINIKTDPMTGAPRGFCFIVFSEAKVVDDILASGVIEINGKKVDPQRVPKTTTPRKVFVGGLTSEFTEDKLKEHFGKYGTITGIEWPYDKLKNQKRPYCFITFENRDAVTEVLKTPKVEVCGKELDVKKVKFNPETMWQYGIVGAYAMRGGRPAYVASYGAAYAYPSYAYDYTTEYADYGAYCKDYEEAYIDPCNYEAYAAPFGPRAPRGGRTAGGYTRHTPY